MSVDGQGWVAPSGLEHIGPALVKALAELDDVAKDKTATVPTKAGGQFSYSYADLATALAAIRPALGAHGLAQFQSVRRDGGIVYVSTTVIHESGECIVFAPLAMPAGQDPQSTGSAITYARRYSLLPAVGIATEDDDGAAASRARPTSSHPVSTVTRPRQAGARQSGTAPAPEGPATDGAGTARLISVGQRHALHAKMRETFPEARAPQMDRFRHALAAAVTRDRETGSIESSNDLTPRELSRLTQALDQVQAGAASVADGPDGTVDITVAGQHWRVGFTPLTVTLLEAST